MTRNVLARGSVKLVDKGITILSGSSPFLYVIMLKKNPINIITGVSSSPADVLIRTIFSVPIDGIPMDVAARCASSPIRG